MITSFAMGEISGKTGPIREDLSNNAASCTTFLGGTPRQSYCRGVVHAGPTLPPNAGVGKVSHLCSDALILRGA